MVDLGADLSSGGVATPTRILLIAADLKIQVDALTWKQRTSGIGRSLQRDLVRVLGRLHAKRHPRYDRDRK